MPHPVSEQGLDRSAREHNFEPDASSPDDPFQLPLDGKNSILQLHLTNMTPRKGARMKKLDKNSDSESETPSTAETTRETMKEGTNIAKSNGLANNPRVFGRLIVFGGILIVTFATRFYTLEDPTHIW